MVQIIITIHRQELRSVHGVIEVDKLRIGATQGTGSAQPTFRISGSDKYVDFDGGDSLDFTDYTIPTAFNMVVVCNTNSDADTLLLLERIQTVNMYCWNILVQLMVLPQVL